MTSVSGMQDVEQMTGELQPPNLLNAPRSSVYGRSNSELIRLSLTENNMKVIQDACAGHLMRGLRRLQVGNGSGLARLKISISRKNYWVGSKMEGMSNHHKCLEEIINVIAEQRWH